MVLILLVADSRLGSYTSQTLTGVQVGLMSHIAVVRELCLKVIPERTSQTTVALKRSTSVFWPQLRELGSYTWQELNSVSSAEPSPCRTLLFVSGRTPDFQFIGALLQGTCEYLKGRTRGGKCRRVFGLTNTNYGLCEDLFDVSRAGSRNEVPRRIRMAIL